MSMADWMTPAKLAHLSRTNDRAMWIALAGSPFFTVGTAALAVGPPTVGWPLVLVGLALWTWGISGLLSVSRQLKARP